MDVLDDGAGGGNNDGRRQGAVNLFKAWKDWKDGVPTADGDVDISALGQGGGGGDNPGFDFGDSGDEEEDLDLLPADVAGAGPTNDLERGVVVDLEQLDEITVAQKQKTEENDERERAIAKLQAEHVAFMRKLKAMPVAQQEKKEKLKIKMMEITDRIEELRGEAMTELKFWGLLALDDDAGGFDYGREILKDAVYETRMELPYGQLPLFTANDWSRRASSSPIVQVAGILRSGKLSGATIKAGIRMKESGEDDSADAEEEETRALKEQDNTKKAEGKQGMGGGGGDGGNRWEKINAICSEVAADFPFDVFVLQYLEHLTMDCVSYRVRVYLISAQNLTATGSKLDVKSRLAGMTAMCVANPYPALTLGDGRNDDEKK